MDENVSAAETGKTALWVGVLLALMAAGSLAASEHRLTTEEIRTALIGHTFRHADVTKVVLQTFPAKDVTYYYDGSEQSEGRWEVRGGKYCGQWPPRKTWNCFFVASKGNHFTFISASGARYFAERKN